ncbi:MAG: hypothetical protein M1308_14250 [Actinobacteria bacterium]|nr:hypothetical protein [Actinomycetota bacterium]
MAAINATGIWTEVNYGQKAIFAAGNAEELKINKKDKEILKKLASKVQKIALKKSNLEKKKLWYEHNELKLKRPLIFCDPENGWNEIFSESMLRCTGVLAKRWELVLLKEIYYDEQIKDDKPIELFFDLSYKYSESDWIDHRVLYGGKSGGTYKWEGQIKNLDDAANIKYPQIKVDYKTTLGNLDLANDIFEGLLIPRIKGQWWWSLGLTIDLVFLIGLENMFIYFYDNPAIIHAVLGKLSEGWLEKIKFLEKNNLLSLNNDDSYVGSGGLGYTSELALSGYPVGTKDIWGFAESQETVCVSPQMFEEFIFPYQNKMLNLFGLNCYGCCEPLDKRWHIVKRFKNLRRVSVSKWADYRKMAEYLEDKYIFSYKPSPTDLAVTSINEDYIRKNIKDFLSVTNGCVIELLMKDNHTLGNNPENLENWVKIVRREIDKIY